jgi:hypothetical protein
LAARRQFQVSVRNTKCKETVLPSALGSGLYTFCILQNAYNPKPIYDAHYQRKMLSDYGTFMKDVVIKEFLNN